MERLKKIFVTIFVFSLLAGLTAGCSNRFVAGIRKLFVRRPASSAVTNGQIEQARQGIKPVVRIEDGAGSQVQQEIADQDEVVTPGQAAHYRELAMTKPHDPVVRYNTGRLYLQQGLLKDATYEFDMATSLDSEFTNAFLLLGRTLRMRELYDLAIAKLNRAAKLQPDLSLVHIELGICWDERGYHEKARDAYLKAQSLTPGDAHIYNNMGYSYFLEGNYKRAIKLYRKALQLDPDDKQTNNNIALAYALRQKWEKSLHHFTVALGEAAAQNNIGHLLLRAGHVDEAMAHLEMAVRLDPSSVRALGNLESALRLKGRIEEAEQLHARLVEAERAQARPRFVSTPVERAASAIRGEDK